MTYIKRVKFKDVSGKYHSYIATYINGVISDSDWQNIQTLKYGSDRENEKK